MSGPDANKECVFPFKFDGITYNECIYKGNKANETEPWCSTKTNSNGNHVSGQGNWGFCSSEVS